MAGEVLSRAYTPAKSAFEQVGEMMILTAKTIVSAIRPPYPYGEELVWQFLFVLKLSWFPLLISTFALCLGAPGLQAAGVLSLFGALDRLGGFFVLTAIRWIGPLVTAVVVAGVAGTAITADLGARKIREELDALQVLGVDPVKNLVVPRFLALMVVTALLDIFAIVFGLSAGIAAELLYHQSLGGFFATLFSNASVTDIWGSVLMCTMFGAIISVVCSLQGDDRLRRRRGGRPRRQPGGRHRPGRGLLLQLRLHRGPARHQPRTADDPVIGWLDVPRGWLDSFGEIARFGSRVAGLVYSGRVLRFFGESLRQAGILILGSALIIWAFVFILGLQCGLQGAYFNRSIGRALAGRALLRLLRPARGPALRLRLHPLGQGRHRDRRRARRDADLRRDRRARGDGDPAGHLPLPRPACSAPGSRSPSSTWSGSASPTSPATSRWSSRSATSPRAATC